MKLQYLGIGFLVAGELLREWKRISLKEWGSWLVYGLVVLLPPLAWYAYSAKLIQESGLYDFGLQTKPAESLEQALYVLKKNILSDLPELLLGYIAFGGLLFILILALRKGRLTQHPLFLPLLIFALGFSLYHVLELRVLEHHQYYMLPYLTVMIPLAAKGLVLFSKNRHGLWLTFLGIEVVLCAFRMIPSRFAGDKMIPQAFWNEASRNALQKAIPEDALIITGPDESVCINFYFLHKKGWGYNHASMLMDTTYGNGKPYIQDAIQRGCEYLVTTDELSTLQALGVQPYLQAQVFQAEEFFIYRLQDPEE
ncbi:MAG: hypothetical protein LPK45_01055 [Bacteroidota bacterium]|nr:hypothetical protein [Bacteroidota bacterium]MDX5429616.1 hypothetical protein [Bacteroidota bacterium]MDX5468400.1 hypothetical protein [Bacteroidota bacterium]